MDSRPLAAFLLCTLHPSSLKFCTITQFPVPLLYIPSILRLVHHRTKHRQCPDSHFPRRLTMSKHFLYGPIALRCRVLGGSSTLGFPCPPKSRTAALTVFSPCIMNEIYLLIPRSTIAWTHTTRVPFAQSGAFLTNMLP
ncbi:hypothetical protein GALMADRAFT_1189502 [Galerina marginata CBS 339.88]|uniref:Uncharacterized protein n=1 Tax=Galerina marginata (strain CBS 339.88) TaxID=685588 RepID=A0A067TMV9_GALM3|nr:hypothetical protein GALMADRAFT_1189502 [Galerina marginata CBS 339.88]